MNLRGGRPMGMKGAVRCPGCKSPQIEYQGVDETGSQKWRCRNCGQKFTFKPAETKQTETKAA
jgi:transposase-like protein